MGNLIIIFFILTACFAPNWKAAAQEPAVINAQVLEDADDFDEETTDEKTFDKINEVVQKIYDKILMAKAQYRELADFDEKSLTKNQDGFYTIHYETQIPSAGGKTTLYAFKLDVEPLKADTYNSHEGYFNYPLPLLNKQFAGYIIKHPLRRQFDLSTVLNQCAEELADYQQKFMPLRFLIIPAQESFKVHEPIRFKVVLANISQQNILVESLGRESLFFTLNGATWGATAGEAESFEGLSAKEMVREQRRREREMRAAARAQSRQARNQSASSTIRGKRTMVGDKLILRSNEALTIDFTGEGYKRAQNVEIRGIYQLNFKGLKPTATAVMKIVE